MGTRLDKVCDLIRDTDSDYHLHLCSDYKTMYQPAYEDPVVLFNPSIPHCAVSNVGHFVPEPQSGDRRAEAPDPLSTDKRKRSPRKRAKNFNCSLCGKGFTSLYRLQSQFYTPLVYTPSYNQPFLPFKRTTIDFICPRRSR